jgi:hypothetical protein
MATALTKDARPNVANLAPRAAETPHKSTGRAEFQSVLTAATLGADQAIEKTLSDKRAQLVNAEVVCKHHEERCAGFVQSNNRDLYRKERVELDFATARRDGIRTEIDALEKDRPAAIARAKAECERKLDDREALEREGAEIQRDLKKAEQMIAFLADFCTREAVYYRRLVLSNGGLPAGIEPLPPPEAALRYEPGIPARQNGMRKVERSRLRRGMEDSNISGVARYETYVAEEPIIVPEVRAFEPLPLYRTVIVPAFTRDGPHYIPPGVTRPW